MFRYPLLLLSTLALMTASAWAQPRITFSLSNGPVYQPGFRQCAPRGHAYCHQQRVNCGRGVGNFNRGRNYYQGYGYGNRYRNPRQVYRNQRRHYRNVRRRYVNNRGRGRCR